MLIDIKKPSLFISQRMLNQVAVYHRLTRLHRVRWCFIATMDVPFKRKEDLTIEKMGSLFKMEPEAFQSLVIERLEKYKGVTGVRTVDGILAHPEALGRVIEKMMKKLVREMEKREDS